MGGASPSIPRKTHYVMPLDTVGKKARMDTLTKEMDNIENDIKKL